MGCAGDSTFWSIMQLFPDTEKDVFELLAINLFKLLTTSSLFKKIVSKKEQTFSYLLDESEEKIDILEDISKRLNLPVRKIKLEKDISKIPKYYHDGRIKSGRKKVLKRNKFVNRQS